MKLLLVSLLAATTPSLLIAQSVSPAQRVALAQMRKTLIDLSTAEEAYFADHSTYTSDWRRTTYVAPSPTAHVAVVRASARGFVGQVTDDRLLGVSCMVVIGETQGPDAAAINAVASVEPLCYPSVQLLRTDDGQHEAVEASEDRLFADAARRESRRQSGPLTLVNASAIEIPASSYITYPFTLADTRGCVLSGHVLGLAGGNKDVDVILFDADGFTNWKNHNTARTLFNPGKATATTISARLPGPGSYVLVFSNTFSAVTRKTVQAQAGILCQ